jgi:hypothetical protein
MGWDPGSDILKNRNVQRWDEERERKYNELEELENHLLNPPA